MFLKTLNKPVVIVVFVILNFTVIFSLCFVIYNMNKKYENSKTNSRKYIEFLERKFERIERKNIKLQRQMLDLGIQPNTISNPTMNQVSKNFDPSPFHISTKNYQP